MEIIRDMLYVKSVERRLGRSLSEEEMDGESHRVFLPNGNFEFVQVPLLNFPYDLLSKPEDMFMAEIEELLNAA
jgi:hypothetical protein